MMQKQTDLFADAQDGHRPLADRLRPQSLSDYIGQAHLLAEGRSLYSLLHSGSLPSILLWGPPGCGKTTLALLCAQYVDAEFIRLSAVFSGVKEVRETVREAAERRRYQRKTILFIDEIHRFNKAQQDAFLPFVEDGTIILIGATTENPSFHLNNALLSRLHVFHLRALTEQEILQALRRGLAALHYPCAAQTESILQEMAYQAHGDVRKAINWLEHWHQLVLLDMDAQEALHQVLQEQPKLFDKQGDWFYEMLSAFHKSLRGSSADGAMYWFARMISAGCEPLIIARRMLCVASEDIGNADPQALQIATNAYLTYERLGSPEGYLALAQAVTYLALAPKSNASYRALKSALALVDATPPYTVPLHLRNAPTQLLKDEQYGAGYRYAHDEPQGYAAGQSYLPPELGDVRLYHPSERGYEKRHADKLEKLRLLDQQYQSP